jgi:hypothetical protein
MYVNYDSQTGAVITRLVAGINDAQIANPPAGTALLEVDEAEALKTVEPGWTVASGKLIAPPAPTDAEKLTSAKAAQTVVIDAARAQAAAAPVTVYGAPYDADPASQARITAMATAVANNAAPATIQWRDANNRTQNLSPAQFMAMARAVMAQVEGAYNRSFALKDQIAAATTVAAVAAVVWPS